MLREECRCGHDKATHFRSLAERQEGRELPAEILTCLASACPCKRFEQRKDPAR